MNHGLLRHCHVVHQFRILHAPFLLVTICSVNEYFPFLLFFFVVEAYENLLAVDLLIIILVAVWDYRSVWRQLELVVDDQISVLAVIVLDQMAFHRVHLFVDVFGL